MFAYQGGTSLACRCLQETSANLHVTPFNSNGLPSGTAMITHAAGNCSMVEPLVYPSCCSVLTTARYWCMLTFINHKGLQPPYTIIPLYTCVCLHISNLLQGHVPSCARFADVRYYFMPNLIRHPVWLSYTYPGEVASSDCRISLLCSTCLRFFQCIMVPSSPGRSRDYIDQLVSTIVVSGLGYPL